MCLGIRLRTPGAWPPKHAGVAARDLEGVRGPSRVRRVAGHAFAAEVSPVSGGTGEVRSKAQL